MLLKDFYFKTKFMRKMQRTFCGPISFEKNSIPPSSAVHILLHKSKSSTCPMFLSKRCGKAFQLFAFCLLFTDSIIYNSWCYLCFINKIFYDWNFLHFYEHSTHHPAKYIYEFIRLIWRNRDILLFRIIIHILNFLFQDFLLFFIFYIFNNIFC